ncbi:MarR family winged helix-turn-helix transcriptional regulator [Flaviflexus equikiangi]|uniref:MarR family transcriptional regulator n=1 Tax=Flaviflexus equikiangi TaxID=2758573 RepID=A0ABS2TH65_9ACTO|nr:MarR family transcriptional regulator [Flaviflexus equikiangi]MBM9433990.1 MarR family transcriptional regulator [Flaviflexus equikiangi]
MTNDELMKKFRYAMHLMKPHGRGPRGPHHPAADPTRGQGRILAALKLQDNIPTKDLAFILGMRVASLNELLVKLEAAGLVTRSQSEEDRRVVLISLTEDGRSIEQLQPETPDAFAPLTDEQRAQLDEILDRMIDHLESLTEQSESSDLTSWTERARERLGEDRFEAWLKDAEKLGPDSPLHRFGRRRGIHDIDGGHHHGNREHRGGCEGKRHGGGKGRRGDCEGHGHEGHGHERRHGDHS